MRNGAAATASARSDGKGIAWSMAHSTYADGVCHVPCMWRPLRSKGAASGASAPSGWARSSAGEHRLDMAGGTGSIPVAPTIRSLRLAPARVEDELGVAVRLLPALEDQVAGCLECGAVRVACHWPVIRVGRVLPV